MALFHVRKVPAAVALFERRLFRRETHRPGAGSCYFAPNICSSLPWLRQLASPTGGYPPERGPLARGCRYVAGPQATNH
jgi:hypothetical protein